ncbi:hypothetical protein J4Q44_G00357940 [Coregonus suidteri]|uniref:Uncharacterized protein n=1 Tax=Coregonus suidteri TaxID=861788 RepID=A0AAN8KKY3_9TELE
MPHEESSNHSRIPEKYSKQAREGCLKTFNFRTRLVEQAVKRQEDKQIIHKDPDFKVDTPDLPPNIAPVEKPTKEELVAKLFSLTLPLTLASLMMAI